jgi:tetratricopeptide (TPR) repeat protein
MVGWELRVLAVRLQGMGFNDARRGVMGYYDLGRDARSTLSFLKKRLATANEGEKEGTEAEIRLWTERLEDLGIRVASALIEMEDLPGAILHLSSLPSTPEISLKKALLYLHLGDVDAARSTLSSSPTAEGENKEKEQTLQALLHMTDNNYDAAATTWDALISTCPNSSQIALWRQNLAVTLLYLGRGDEVRIPYSYIPLPP